MFNARNILLACVVLITWPDVSHADLNDQLVRFLSDLGNNSSGETEILNPDEAFIMSTEVPAADRVIVRWQIADGYYLYQDKFNFAIKGGNVALGKVAIPGGVLKHDPVFGDVEVLWHDVEITLTPVRQGRNATPVELVIGYQGCKEDAICYPPISKTVSLLLKSVAAPAMAAETGTKMDQGPGGKVISRQDSITQSLKDGNVLLNILTFFSFGLLLALTPCVFPMIPILSGIIIGQGDHITHQRAFFLSLAYVLAMAVTYAVLGVIAGSFHFNLQAASQNTWAIVVFSGIFVLLALSMFGFYELQLPGSWHSRLSAAGNSQERNSLRGASVMGLLSAIIVGPCVAPPLAGALLYISQTGNAVLGGFALLSMGLGMGAPLIIIGTSAGKLLPKAGAWMESIKRVFGVIMLGVAIWFLERVLPGPVTLMLWALLFIVTAIYMGALDRLDPDAGWQRLWKGLGLAMLVYGGALIVGAASGGQDVFRPLQGIATNSGQIKQLVFVRIKSVDDLDRVLAVATEKDKAVMLDFYADWCITCKEMEKLTFPDPEVRQVLQDVILLKADVTANDENDNALLKRFELFGPPAILFFGNGEERKAFRLIGFVESEVFVQHVREATAL
ncbi:MAG: protein-disulfide reductase DsbD [Gammaproteobacteria bacterium]|nr:protein-disulfide reductase DsbD [Gammaproteobacteria bacterium]